MNVEVVQRRLWEQPQQHRKHMHQPQRIATVCDRVLKRSNNQDSLESRMLGNSHVRFGVGAGVRFPGPHHASNEISKLHSVLKTDARSRFGAEVKMTDALNSGF